MAARTAGKQGPGYATLDKDGKKVTWEPGLPADVVRRERKPVRKEAEKKPEELQVPCDLKATLKLTPNAKANWLDEALAAIPCNRCQPLDIYDIVTHPKFSSGVPEKVGRRMRLALKESLPFFSEKQRGKLMARCRFAEDFRSQDSDSDAWRPKKREEGDDSSSAENISPAPERRGRRSPSCDRETRGRSDDRDGPRDSRRRFTETATSFSGRPAPPSDRGEQPPPPEDFPQRSREREDEHHLEAELADFREKEQERVRKNEEHRKKAEEERRVHQEREQQRKAKISSAFLVGGDDEPEELERREATRAKDERPKSTTSSLPFLPLNKNASALSAYGAAAVGKKRDGADPSVTSVGDPLKGALTILRDKAGDSLRSPSRDRRRKRSRSRSRSRRRGWEPRRSRNERSPSRTADGQKRGQARAARKAKMMAQLLGVGSR